MSRRYEKTLADYLVIALSPVLIMTLISALVFFLLEVFYRGTYVARLHYILTWFIIAAVLIARIAIEEGAERAAAFAVPLAGAVLLSINRFVEFHGVMPESLSMAINCGLVALIWWCAHKLTWDCTMIDESAPSSGAGLLDAAGLGAEDPGNPVEWGRVRRRPTMFWRKWWVCADLTHPTIENAQVQKLPVAGRWGFLQNKPQPHAPGRWVIYFSLAALPIFGVGQLFIPSEKLGLRQYAFCLLAVYLASALGLLLTTSFLGLRRYLRQRRLPMPLVMANTWIVLGCVLILCVMFAALLVPRPNAEYAMSQVPPMMGSPDQKASKHGFGREGAKGNQPTRLTKITKDGRKTVPGKDANQPGSGQGNAKSDKPGDVKAGGDKSGEGNSQGDQSSGKSGGDSHESRTRKQDKLPTPAGPGKPESKQRNSDSSEKQGDDKSGSAKAADAVRSNNKQGQANKPDNKSDNDSSTGKGDEAKTQPPKEGPSSAAKDEKSASSEPAEQSQDANSDEPDGADASSADEASATPPQSSFSIMSLLPILQYLFYAAVIGFGLYWAWRHYEKLQAAFAKLLAGLNTFWDSLFGRRRQAKIAESDALVKAIARPFAAYSDPFASGAADKLSPEQLVRYTFAALEAWARENATPREPDQTPHEFANDLGNREPLLRQSALTLANLFCEAAYAPGRLRSLHKQPLVELWRVMHTVRHAEAVRS
jgi:hypothetical protein